MEAEWRCLRRSGYEIEIVIPYDFQKEFEHICTKNDVKIVNKEYLESIKVIFEVSSEKYVDLFENGEFCDLTSKILRIKYIAK